MSETPLWGDVAFKRHSLYYVPGYPIRGDVAFKRHSLCYVPEYSMRGDVAFERHSLYYWPIHFIRNRDESSRDIVSAGLTQATKPSFSFNKRQPENLKGVNQTETTKQ